MHPRRASIAAVSGLLAAARYLTIVPFPGPGHAPAETLGRTAAWFPVVGAGLGLVLAGAERLGSSAFPPLLAALLTVTLWKLLTGGLHLDGLADCLDGLSGRDPAHRLAIMRDSRIGSFGAVGLILLLLLEVATLAEVKKSVCAADVVYVGDYHTLKLAQTGYLDLVREAVKTNRRVVLALELVEGRHQPTLDDFLAGTLDEAE